MCYEPINSLQCKTLVIEYIGVYTAAELAKKQLCVRGGVFLVSFIQHVEHPVTVR